MKNNDVNANVRINVGYTITDSIHVSDTEFVLGELLNDEVRMYATWACKDEDYYYCGHYFSDLLEAKADLLNRASEELEHGKRQHILHEKPCGGKTESPDSKPEKCKKEQEYERFKLQWMLSHGYTLRDLISVLSEYQQDSEESDISSVFSAWELDYGFGSEIWPCFDEYLDCEDEPDNSSGVKISPDRIKKSEQVLIDNGIDPDEAQTVLQALGYTLLDIELDGYFKECSGSQSALTKNEIQARLLNGEILSDLIQTRSGQKCEIFKANSFYPGDEVIYIPDMELNEIPLDTPVADQEEIEKILSNFYTGNNFIELCGGDKKLAERLFYYCDWQHPSSALNELDDDDEED